MGNYGNRKQQKTHPGGLFLPYACSYLLPELSYPLSELAHCCQATINDAGCCMARHAIHGCFIVDRNEYLDIKIYFRYHVIFVF